jgi:hypothetical protein
VVALALSMLALSAGMSAIGMKEDDFYVGSRFDIELFYVRLYHFLLRVPFEISCLFDLLAFGYLPLTSSNGGQLSRFILLIDGGVLFWT